MVLKFLFCPFRFQMFLIVVKLRAKYPCNYVEPAQFQNVSKSIYFFVLMVIIHRRSMDIL